MSRRAPTAYNERSWAIDVIGHIKSVVNKNNRSIKDAGGEQTIATDGGSLFPDVLLFGDRETARILQGWELKMPDTSINDFDFRVNAETKARALGLDSFLLWNVCHARLYARDSNSDNFVLMHEWNDLRDLVTRGEVKANRTRWESLATTIIANLNHLFDTGTLQGRQFIEAYRTGGITSLIMENASGVKHSLIVAARRNAALRNQMTLWWELHSAEYAAGTKEEVLARAIISNWIGKFLFAHILREQDVRAQNIFAVTNETTPQQALELFRQLSEQCNFWTIFSDSIGLTVLTSQTWSQLKQFNNLLADLRIGSVDQTQLSNILEATVEVARRKLRGQYPTPIELSRLLVQLSVRDLTRDRLLDPCCGSGTIARSALEQRISNGIEPEEAAKLIYASDQDPQAVQIATFAMAKPSLMHVPIRIFQMDAFKLKTDTEIEFKNPSNGRTFSEQLGKFEAIASNLPFIAQAGRHQYGNALKNVRESMLHGRKFTGRADVAAYLPFTLSQLLSNNGRLGIIITNAWLGTDWGDDFYKELSAYYYLRFVITSGAGRWFRNSDVVTNILILDKKISPAQQNGDVSFVVLKRPIEELTDDEAVEITAAQIELGQTQDDSMTIRTVSQENMEAFRKIGLGGNAQFVNCDWILELPLTPLKELFHIGRGARRGKNEFFYPKGKHLIEREYLRPLAKSSREFTHLTMTPTKEAFSCSRSKAELRQLKHKGALAWIERFESDELVRKLSKPGIHWYEMRTDDLADLVLFINYGDRLFAGRLNPPSFADQRFVPLVPVKDIDVDLVHALLNSAIGMFIIEGFGFGRALGALDQNKNRIEKYMHMLNPNALNEAGVRAIKAAFAPLTARPILPVADELEQQDRIAFDDAVIDAFNLEVLRVDVYSSLLALIEIRRTATE